ncbi:hypothetical protein OG455_41125 [Kitasatospora sp. NBC_01287]|uniref:putative phage holin n=1 Tax=Kitasatospora sp. NBC_01287 TaxID=2903573 RepID=UPI002254832A|nr:hypothetical protein [Kitasatospora sp. NBC_01287]MCX4750885.1 hypothetical protein [Kitasatospora sp. NBC_01287]MCX4751844.1 hypothetical protein [Kitasatospora sp. NBC_01287]
MLALADLSRLDWSQLANVSASALIAIACTRTVAVYRRAPWRSSRVGRHMMTVTVSIGLLGAYTVAATLWPSGPVSTVLRVVRVVVLMVLAVLMHQRARMVADGRRGKVEPIRDPMKEPHQ